MKNNIIITISREFGSGGREIGEKLAKELNIPFYDKEIILKAAEDSGLSADYIEAEEQKVTSSMMYSMSAGYVTNDFRPASDKIYTAQLKAIKHYAEQAPCVIVGRCADYILKDYDNCINVFVSADEDFKVDRIMRIYGVKKSEAEKRIREIDKRRAKHYKYYTAKNWGSIENYHMCINTGKFGIDKSVQVIKQAAENL